MIFSLAEGRQKSRKNERIPRPYLLYAPMYIFFIVIILFYLLGSGIEDELDI